MSDDAIDFERVNLLLNIAKTIDESFPKLASLSAEAKDELGELDQAVRAERAEEAKANRRRTGVMDGMPADSAPRREPAEDEEQPVRRAIPANKPTVARKV